MTTLYSNLPSTDVVSNQMVKAFDAYTNKSLELDTNTLTAMKGFFTSRGFENSSAESISVIIIKQAKADNLNPITILDTLKGLDDVEISALIAEILNYNRIKSSFLGYARQFNTSSEIKRNILA
jgi:hypothetical protein